MSRRVSGALPRRKVRSGQRGGDFLKYHPNNNKGPGRGPGPFYFWVNCPKSGSKSTPSCSVSPFRPFYLRAMQSRTKSCSVSGQGGRHGQNPQNLGGLKRPPLQRGRWRTGRRCRKSPAAPGESVQLCSRRCHGQSTGLRSVPTRRVAGEHHRPPSTQT